jgi:hypothetical protein
MNAADYAEDSRLIAEHGEMGLLFEFPRHGMVQGSGERGDSSVYLLSRV